MSFFHAISQTVIRVMMRLVLRMCSFQERTCYNVEVFISHRATQAECQVPAVEKVSHIQ